ncbi:hypothetical protein JCM3766R1_005284, partial [Sporobolomyces carnicolor]
TTAGTISAIFAFLAIYPSWQNSIHDEVSTHLEHTASGRNFTYSNSYRSLAVTLAVVQETLRLAGPAQALLRKSTGPTYLPSRRVAATDGTLSEGDFVRIPARAHVREHVQGVHYTDVWDDPTAFNPARFLEKEKLAERMKGFESVALVASIMLKYKVEIPIHEQAEWALKDGESENDRRNRVLKPLNFFALAPHAIDLVFVPRD